MERWWGMHVSGLTIWRLRTYNSGQFRSQIVGSSLWLASVWVECKSTNTYHLVYTWTHNIQTIPDGQAPPPTHLMWNWVSWDSELTSLSLTFNVTYTTTTIAETTLTNIAIHTSYKQWHHYCLLAVAIHVQKGLFINRKLRDFTHWILK